jgi:hypothetical protein
MLLQMFQLFVGHYAADSTLAIALAMIADQSLGVHFPVNC